MVGPEDPLTKGITDKFKAEGLRCFGPDSEGAKLEGSKSFSKFFMKKYGVKTAEYEVFTNPEEALSYLYDCEYPIVIKADGLAAGKGVVICESKKDAMKAVQNLMIDDAFNGAGQKIVVEEYAMNCLRRIQGYKWYIKITEVSHLQEIQGMRWQPESMLCILIATIV